MKQQILKSAFILLMSLLTAIGMINGKIKDNGVVYICSKKPNIGHHFSDCSKLKKCNGKITTMDTGDFFMNPQMKTCKTCDKRMPQPGPDEGD